MNKILKLNKFFQKNASLVLNLNPIHHYDTSDEMQLKTEEHEKQIAEFMSQFVNRVLPLYDSRLIIAVFDTGKLDLKWVQKVRNPRLYGARVSRLFFDAFLEFRKQVFFEINLLDKYLYTTLKDFHKYIGRIENADNWID